MKKVLNYILLILFLFTISLISVKAETSHAKCTYYLDDNTYVELSIKKGEKEITKRAVANNINIEYQNIATSYFYSNETYKCPNKIYYQVVRNFFSLKYIVAIYESNFTDATFEVKESVKTIKDVYNTSTNEVDEDMHSCKVTIDGKYDIIIGASSNDVIMASFEDLKSGEKKTNVGPLNPEGRWTVNILDNNVIVFAPQLSLIQTLKSQNSCPSIRYVLNSNQSGEGVSWFDLYTEKDAQDLDSTLVTIQTPVTYSEHLIPDCTCFQYSNVSFDLCESGNALKVFKAIGVILNILKILIPIVIIIFGTIDLAKMVMSNEDISKGIKNVSLRIVLGVVIFFIPTIIKVIFNTIDLWDNTISKFNSCADCLFNPSSCYTEGKEQIETICEGCD